MKKLLCVLQEELQSFHPRLALANLLLMPLPLYVGSRLRTAVLRHAGFRIGRGTVIWGTPTITGSKNLYAMLTIGNHCWINVGCFFELGAPITIDDRVGFGHQVLLITTTHEIGIRDRRTGQAYSQPIKIGTGAWIGSRTTILPGITVGEGAVIGSGAVVNKDVPANSLVAGVPAKVIRFLDEDEIIEGKYAYAS